jgi:acyl-coenzyme A thioesterase PaaI-like protein
MNAPAGFTVMNVKGGFLVANGPFHARREGERMVIGLRIEDRHCNSNGVAHGGLVLGFSDFMLTAGLNYGARMSRFLVTVSASCDFAGPAKLGDWMEGRVDVLRVTRNMVFGQGLITTQDGSLVARISGVLKYSGEPDPKYSASRYLPPEA